MNQRKIADELDPDAASRRLTNAIENLSAEIKLLRDMLKRRNRAKDKRQAAQELDAGPDKLVTQKEAAEILGMSSRRLSEMRSALGLVRHPASSLYRPRYRLSEVAALVESNKKR